MIDEQKFLAAIRSDNADERFAAWRQAGQAPPSSIAELGKLAGSGNPAVAKAAAEALTTMVHAVGKDPAAPNRAGVVRGLLALAGGGPLPVRVHALRLLSNIAGEDAAPAIAAHLNSPELREEAVFALERIPGNASIQAIMAAYKPAPAEFKPRLLAALGHRRAPEAATLVADAMRSTDKEIAIAAVRAYGRIGAKQSSQPSYPSPDTFSGWQRNEDMDGMLRYADAMAKQGNPADAMAIYKTALASPEEHWQCAAIIGMAKIGSPEATDAILPKLKSDRRTVRITAQQAWRRIAG
jgi:HEAT repeat protein